MQTTSKVFMVKPIRFGYNPQTASSNAFQKKGFENGAQSNALREFMSYVSILKANGISVAMAEDTEYPFTPDSIFPNNWFSTHEDGTLVLYPLSAFNRRNERKSEFIDLIRRNFNVKRLVDLTYWEEEEKFLEGTGSMVLDRENKIVYSCHSPRTSAIVLEDFCKKLGYKSVTFTATDDLGGEIYHTNVMMSIGTKFAIICFDTIRDEKEKKTIKEGLEKANKQIIEISFEQLNCFAGNMIELENKDGKPILIMSGSARKSLTPEQVKTFLNYYHRLLAPHLDYIENNGGGSARCMVAEVF